jgi:hypothetical protein
MQIEVAAELGELVDCNCSTCVRSGFLHWKVPAASVRLITQGRRLSTYVWRSVTEGHHFCPTCGIALMRTGYQDGIVSLNARCIEGIDIFALAIRKFDGRHEMPPGPREKPLV